ncbi:Sugar transferase involved in LPS biosynthesis (colanic, teichoic acid) [Roseivivax sediminis]|uniref:Sugar transferase involved in LPS biosynthesis (Colanic, teichoic acid) n=1 Tax=Roseivivax sediminis TaxID=936889 RepID=A0A1I2DE45_9RHOB|nr:Sugar transferase involved in LPS biosynthesis (colanic, teichoic acid) [Roseivivax sediminis]
MSFFDSIDRTGADHTLDGLAHSSDIALLPEGAIADLSSRRALGSGVYKTFLKRALDVTFVVICAPVAVTIIVLCALLIALDGSNPFFTQMRVGRGGRTFRMLKLRSMIPNAERVLEQHLDENAAARHEWDTTQKLKMDPRVTRVGRFIRKCSIDELPQLWNVLIGDMSMVGPRPMMQQQRSLYPGESYYELRPGITGNWQVTERNETSFAARARFDDAYAETLSFSGDMSLLARTVSVVLRCTGH